MQIAVFGGTGRLGGRIVAEAEQRGHECTVVVRDVTRSAPDGCGARVVRGDATDPQSVAAIAADHEVLVSSIRPEITPSSNTVVDAAHAFLVALRAVPATRLIVVGGAGTLLDRHGVRLLDDPEFPEQFKPFAQSHADALDVYRLDKEVRWTYLSPADDLLPGERTGRYRLDADRLVYDSRGSSLISMEDLAVAVVDEAEQPRHLRQRFTVGY
ncbi:NAD(P)-dependent oxidoreductase [Streptomyces platensis]|uniref:NAD(P)-dependent oxidoreductase n=1 Tax=Streptomyces platensis TaxID=58346 RepID=UPI001F317B93|nr:NAD(P)H-binding protein [Streptomyces platensis]MCF3145193.1 NAD(P)H-binding protein [Streptomyces platensis]